MCGDRPNRWIEGRYARTPGGSHPAPPSSGWDPEDAADLARLLSRQRERAALIVTRTYWSGLAPGGVSVPGRDSSSRVQDGRRHRSDTARFPYPSRDIRCRTRSPTSKSRSGKPAGAAVPSPRTSARAPRIAQAVGDRSLAAQSHRSAVHHGPAPRWSSGRTTGWSSLMVKPSVGSSLRFHARARLRNSAAQPTAGWNGCHHNTSTTSANDYAAFPSRCALRRQAAQTRCTTRRRLQLRNGLRSAVSDPVHGPTSSARHGERLTHAKAPDRTAPGSRPAGSVLAVVQDPPQLREAQLPSPENVRITLYTVDTTTPTTESTTRCITFRYLPDHGFPPRPQQVNALPDPSMSTGNGPRSRVRRFESCRGHPL